MKSWWKCELLIESQLEFRDAGQWCLGWEQGVVFGIWDHLVHFWPGGHWESRTTPKPSARGIAPHHQRDTPAGGDFPNRRGCLPGAMYLDFTAGLQHHPLAATTWVQSRRSKQCNGYTWSLSSAPGFRTHLPLWLTVTTDINCLTSRSQVSHLCNDAGNRFYLTRWIWGGDERSYVKNPAWGLASRMVSAW